MTATRGAVQSARDHALHDAQRRADGFWTASQQEAQRIPKTQHPLPHRPRTERLQKPEWGVSEATGNKSAARNDQDAKFCLVSDQGYEPYGYFIVARDREAHPHEIAETRTSFVVRLQLDRLEDGSIVSTPVDRIEVR